MGPRRSSGGLLSAGLHLCNEITVEILVRTAELVARVARNSTTPVAVVKIFIHNALPRGRIAWDGLIAAAVSLPNKKTFFVRDYVNKYTSNRALHRSATSAVKHITSAAGSVSVHRSKCWRCADIVKSHIVSFTAGITKSLVV